MRERRRRGEGYVRMDDGVHPRLRQEEGLSVTKRPDLPANDVDHSDWLARPNHPSRLSSCFHT